MALERILLNSPLGQNTSDVGQTTEVAAFIDCIIDDAGVFRRRPGLKLFTTFNDKTIDGMYYWKNQNCIIVVCNKKIFRVEEDGSYTTLIGVGATDGVPKFNSPCSFAEYKTNTLYIANGGRIIEYISGSTPTYIADPHAPTNVTHLVVLDTYLIANNVDPVNPARFFWSDVGQPTVWTEEYATAEAKPDILQAISEFNRYLYLFGSNTIEIFRDDGSTPFVKEYQGYVNTGTSARYSVVKCDWDNTFYFLDNSRRIVKLNGTEIIPVSKSINKYIHTFSYTDDCRGFYSQINGRPYILFVFPTEGRTIVLDIGLGDGYWYEWAYWNGAQARHDNFRGGVMVFAESWNKTFIGDRLSGTLFEISDDVYDDAGNTMRTVCRTGRMNHDVESQRKFCRRISFRALKNFDFTGSEEPILMVRYRDNGSPTWSGRMDLTLHNNIGHYQGHLLRLGSYYSRQWEFAFTDNYPLAIATVEEDYIIGGT